MPKIEYLQKKFQSESLFIIEKANEIIAEYLGMGYDLTLRQLYYKFIAKGLIVVEEDDKGKAYKRFGNTISNARLAGYIDWSAIVDRTRNLKSLSHWDSPQEILESAMNSYRRNRWEGQKHYLEVWIEKDALIGVIENVCNKYDVPYFACKGYNSQSEMWRAGERINKHSSERQIPVIIYLGDHDPSGLDMTRDIKDRLNLFTFGDTRMFTRVNILRIALNLDQIEKFNPPPNPAKIKDKRSMEYISQYGNDSWELDALEPYYIEQLIEDKIKVFLDDGILQEVIEKEKAEKRKLRKLIKEF